MYFVGISVFVVCLCCAFQISLGGKNIYVVSIVDSTSVLSCFIKIYSILKSSSSKKNFIFKFLLLDGESSLQVNGQKVEYMVNSISVDKWDLLFEHYFPGVSFETKVWSRPKTLPKLRGTSFEQEYIYARFYLPHIFDDVPKYIYLDNDMVVTGDLKELWDTPLKVSPFVNTNNLVEQRPIVVDKHSKSKQANRLQRITGMQPMLMNHRHVGDLGTDDSRERLQSAEMLRKPPPHRNFKPAVGFVYERHKYYNQYIYDHFNSSHPLMKKLKGEMLSSLFLNAGVAVVDCVLWRERNMTQEAERIISMNQPSWIRNGDTRNGTETQAKEVVIYDDAAGDQGLFYVLLSNRVAYLHAKWNMRRLPMKTVHMLTNTLATGIVHFAGTTHGDGLFFCKAPLQYPIFIADVAPLYLSIASSFANYIASCSTSDPPPNGYSGQYGSSLFSQCSSNTSFSTIEKLTHSYLSIPGEQCNDAVQQLQREHRLNYRLSENNLMVKLTATSKIVPGRFNPGLNKEEFTWPPLKAFPI